MAMRRFTQSFCLATTLLTSTVAISAPTVDQRFFDSTYFFQGAWIPIQTFTAGATGSLVGVNLEFLGIYSDPYVNNLPLSVQVSLLGVDPAKYAELRDSAPPVGGSAPADLFSLLASTSLTFPTASANFESFRWLFDQDIDFTLPAPVIRGGIYAIAVDFSQAAGTNITGNINDPYPDGFLIDMRGAGGDTTVYRTFDMSFQTRVLPVTEPSTAFSCALGLLLIALRSRTASSRAA